MKKRLLILLGGVLVASIVSCSVNQTKQDFSESAQFRDGEFRNDESFEMGGFAETVKITWKFLTEKHALSVPDRAIPVHPISREQLEQETENGVIYRLGHSTLLLRLEGQYWLIDPVFGERASPVSWAGPKRFHAPPVSIAELPDLAGVIISHDHYDHLDKESIRQLVPKVEQFVVPLGVGRYVREWGASETQVTELDWWQGTEVAGVSLTATPAQHFSGRGITGGNRTLWASWVIQTAEQKIFYSGDTGYFDGFKKIGERFGPFDLTIMENGAYNPLWSNIHMSPEDSLQAHLDVRGKVMMPVHNGTFDLAMHAWYEPLERISDLAWDNSVALATPEIGERMVVGAPRQNLLWWEKMLLSLQQAVTE